MTTIQTQNIELENFKAQIMTKYGLDMTINEDEERLEILGTSCREECKKMCCSTCGSRLYDIGMTEELEDEDDTQDHEVLYYVYPDEVLDTEINYGFSPDQKFMGSKLGKKLKAFQVMKDYRGYFVRRFTDASCEEMGCNGDNHVNGCVEILENLGFIYDEDKEEWVLSAQ